MRKFEKELA